MPSASKHLKRAGQHLTVASKFASDTEALGWASVALFYAARDVVHAVFDADPDLADVCRHPTSHSNIDLSKPGTNTVVKRHYRLLELPYMDLYGVSLGVRYEGQQVDVRMFEEQRAAFDEICAWAGQRLLDWNRNVPDWMGSASQLEPRSRRDS